MKIWRVLIVLLLVMAACSDDATSSSDVEVTTSIGTPEETVVSTTTEEIPPTTLLGALDEVRFSAVPVVDAKASATCEWFDSTIAGQSFRPSDCSLSPNVSIEAVTLYCPTDDCSERLEVIVETAGDFGLDQLTLFEGVEIVLEGSTGSLFCVIRDSFEGMDVGCLDSENEMTIPPEDVWLNSEDGLRHVFGVGSNFIGNVEALSVIVTQLGADQRGPLGVFTVVDPTLPGRVEASAEPNVDVARYQLERVFDAVEVRETQVIECVTDILLSDSQLASLSVGAGHGPGNYGDLFISNLSGALESCQPIVDIYAESFGAFGNLSDDCVVQMADAAAERFNWVSRVTDVRAVARGELGSAEQQVIIEEFTFAKYEEFGCLP